MTDVRVPTLPESVTDATVLTWHKKPGDPVSRDENLLDLETDKVVLEVPSPIDGVLTEIKAEEGAVVTSDDILAILTEGAVAAAAPAANEPAAEVPAESDDDPILTPAVRRLVKEMKIDPSHVTGTGKEGRILKSDVMRYLDEQKNQPAEAKEAKAAASAAPDDIALGLVMRSVCP
jgi:2-oxoglutarate dehydrogenase E2 component (dihydrolipoamide succinyltransferase)